MKPLRENRWEVWQGDQLMATPASQSAVQRVIDKLAKSDGPIIVCERASIIRRRDLEPKAQP